jgi:hypothetical protein
MNEKTKQLYDALKDEYDLGTPEEFAAYLQDDSKRQSFYEGVIAEQFDVESLEAFEQVYGLASGGTTSEPAVKKKDSTGSSSEDGSLDSRNLYDKWEQKYNISQAGVSPIPSLDELQVDDDMRDTRVFEEELETTTSGEAPKQDERTLLGELSTESQDATRVDRSLDTPADTRDNIATPILEDIDRSKPIILPDEKVKEVTSEFTYIPTADTPEQKERTLFGELSTEKQDATRIDKGVDIPTEVRDQESYLPRGSKEKS